MKGYSVQGFNLLPMSNLEIIFVISPSFYITYLTFFFFSQQQLAEEEKLANQQAETLKANYKKYEMMDTVLFDGTAKSLANHYDMKGFKPS